MKRESVYKDGVLFPEGCRLQESSVAATLFLVSVAACGYQLRRAEGRSRHWGGFGPGKLDSRGDGIYEETSLREAETGGGLPSGTTVHSANQTLGIAEISNADPDF